MSQTRRQFGKVLTGGVIAIPLGVTSLGLSCGSIFLDIEKYVPVGLSAFQVVINLLDPALSLPVAALISEVKAGFADLQVVVTNYNNAPAANKASLLGKISTAIDAVKSEIQAFWSNLNLPDGSLATLISGLLGVILSTLTAFLPSLPPPIASPSAMKAMRTTTKTIIFVPKKRSVKQFKTDFNDLLVANNQQEQIIY
jgi:hypothetical protein